MLISNSSSSSMTNSTVSSESAPRSLIKFVWGVTFSLSTPSCSATMSITRSATDATFTHLHKMCIRRPNGGKIQAHWQVKTQHDSHRAKAHKIDDLRKPGQDREKRGD